MQTKKQPFDAKKAEKKYTNSEDEFIKEYDRIHKKNEQWVIKRVEKKYNLEDKDYKWVADFVVSIRYRADLKKLLTLYYYDLYFAGREDAINETKHGLPQEFQIDFNITPNDYKKLLEEDQIKQYGALGILSKNESQALRDIQERAFTLVGDDERRQLKTITATLRESLDTDRPLKEVIAKIETNLAEDRKRYALTIARTNASTAYNAGRAEWFNSPKVRPFISAYQYSAILDDQTTQFCEAHHDQIIKKDDPELSIVWPPNHFNCRSVMVPIMTADEENPNSYYYDFKNKFEPWGTNVSGTATKPAKGFGG